MSKSKRKSLRDSFLTWQCHVRQVAMRENGGRPSPGMQPQILDEAGAQLVPGLTVLLAPKEPKESTAFLRFQVLKYADPRETYEKALAYLQADYFQTGKAFSGRLLAALPSDAPLAETLLATKRCVLAFAQGRYAFRLPCKVKRLKAHSADREAAIWHNRVFNPALPDTVQVLAFKPDWDAAETKKI
ncbi:hypothetical protein AUC69_01155 [Methyloceanibacter superfactus]|uniref:Uncharacterized protein n=1 Tax=Methyloceanibacter superfactus TaxID=1774969 RepID=A0A1E3W426_9HYPH|nr:hypothetical protein [Methyloceanibacter superfactus]ODS00490.1 hypothetical protein AUC69_01155 [Methyloceanibacter superfactus]